MQTLIQNARILDPVAGLDFMGELLIKDGKILQIGTSISNAALKNPEYFDAKGLCLAPGFVDIHVHLRDPGFTHKEDIITGAAAAAAGGVTSLCCMPNTKPPVDSKEIIKYIIEKAKNAKARVYPVACITKGLGGKELTDFAELKSAGAVAFSDDGRPVENGGTMLEALRQANALDVPVVSHCEDLSIINGGIINSGEISQKLGVKGMDRASEDSITAREIVLAEASGTAVHICHVSTRGSVQLIREAKARGVRVTCESAPHYMLLTDEMLLTKNANFRMNPPLREKLDCEAIADGFLDGTIDAIVTDHAPHTAEEKADFFKAPNGIVGLETSFAAACTALVHGRGMPLLELVRCMSASPAKIMHLECGTLTPGAQADLVLFDPELSWILEASKLNSKSKNTPFDGYEFKGKIMQTILNGKTVFKI